MPPDLLQGSAAGRDPARVADQVSAWDRMARRGEEKDVQGNRTGFPE